MANTNLREKGTGVCQRLCLFVLILIITLIERASPASAQGLPEHEPVKVLKAFSGTALTLALNKDEKRIAVLGVDRESPDSPWMVRVIDLKTEKVVNQFPADGGIASQLVYSPDGKQLTFRLKQPSVINTMTGKQIGVLQRTNGFDSQGFPTEALKEDYAYSPDSKVLWSFDENAVIGYDMKTFRESRAIPIKGAKVRSIAVLRKRSLIAVGLTNSEVRLYAPGSKTAAPEITLEAPNDKRGPDAGVDFGCAHGFAESSDGKTLLVARIGKNIEIWNLDDQRKMGEFAKTHFSRRMVILGDRTMLTIGEWPDDSRSGSPVIIFDIKSGKRLAYLKAKGIKESKQAGKVPVQFSSFAMQASADGKLLYIPCSDGSVQICDVSEWSRESGE